MKGIESSRALQGRKAVAVINYLEDGLIAGVRRPQGHRAARGYVSERVVERIADDHAQHLRIRPEDDIGLGLHPEVDPALVGQWNVFREKLAKETLDVHLDRFDAVRLRPCEIQQLLGQAPRALDAAAQRRQATARLLE